MVFVLTLGNAFSYRFHFKTNIKSIGSLKNGTRDFQGSPPFEGLSCFYVTISGNFERFKYFYLETDFLENESLFPKTQFEKIDRSMLQYMEHISIIFLQRI